MQASVAGRSRRSIPEAGPRILEFASSEFRVGWPARKVSQRSYRIVLTIYDFGAPTSTEGELVCASVVLIRQDLLTADGLSGVSRNRFPFNPLPCPGIGVSVLTALTCRTPNLQR